MKWLIAASILIGTNTGWAQQADTSVFRIGEIVVRATKPVTTTGGASAVELKIDSLRTQAAPTLDQVLRQIPLVQVRVNSRGESQFSLRGSGSDSREVAVIVDGIPINLGWDHRADLSVVPATAAQTLTLSRGLPSLLYGPNVLGGVVEIGIAQGSSVLNPRALRFDVGADHTGATGVAAAAAMPIKNDDAGWMLRGGGGYRQRNGSALPDSDALRLNTDFEHLDGFASVSYRPGRFWADASVSGYRAERGIAPEIHIASPRFWRYPVASRLLGVVAAGTGQRASPLGGQGDLEVAIGADVGRTEIHQFADATFETIAAEEDSDDRNWTLRLRADQTLAMRGELRAALTYADINHDEVLTPGASASYRQSLWSGAVEVHWHLPGVGVGTRLSAGVAIDGASTPESGDKPPLDALRAAATRVGFTSVLSEQILVHGGASIRSRFPALRELYSGALGRFEPNPELGPERLAAVELGVTATRNAAEVQAVAFHHRLDDAIVRIAAPDRKFKRVNRDRQSTTGLELLGTLRFGDISVIGDVVVQTTRLTDAVAGTQMIPEYQPDVIAGLGVAGPLPLHARFDVRARHTGRQYCMDSDTGGAVDLEDVRRVDAEVSRRWPLRGAWTSAIEFSLGADNLADDVIYDQCGLPQPGRTFRIQLRVR